MVEKQKLKVFLAEFMYNQKQTGSQDLGTFILLVKF